MLLDIIRQFNWVDFLVIIIFLRIIYTAFNNKFPLELFKLLGIVTALYLSLHYYTSLVDLITQHNPATKDRIPLRFFDFISFLVLAIIGYLVFVGLRFVFERFIELEIYPVLNKILSLIVGASRAFLLTGLLVFTLVISSVSYLKNSVRESYSGRQMFVVAPNTYAWIWNNITSKFSNREEFNKTIPQVQKDLNK